MLVGNVEMLAGILKIVEMLVGNVEMLARFLKIVEMLARILKIVVLNFKNCRNVGWIF